MNRNSSCSKFFGVLLNSKGLLFTWAIFLGFCTGLQSQEDNLSHKELATRILQPMRLSETAKTARLVEATEYYLDDLKVILDERSKKLASIEKDYKEDSDAKESLIVEAYVIARDKYLPVKKKYTHQLEEELTPYQVERVKDGLTYDAFPNFHAMYFEMVPKLEPAEKAHILALLVEGRENAMLAISMEGQTQWWDKYRGIINNYIASQGYDFGKLSKIWDKANSDKEWAH